MAKIVKKVSLNKQKISKLEVASNNTESSNAFKTVDGVTHHNCNGPHVPLVVTDEIDTVSGEGLKAFKEISGMLDSKGDKRALRVGISTRKSRCLKKASHKKEFSNIFRPLPESGFCFKEYVASKVARECCRSSFICSGLWERRRFRVMEKLTLIWLRIFPGPCLVSLAVRKRSMNLPGSAMTNPILSIPLRPALPDI